jgi:hypothetical protein
MILSTMNRDELRKNIGQVFKFFPIPRRDSPIGSYESENNQWLLRRESPDKKSFEFLNMIGDYNPLVLDPLKIKNYDAPDILILRGQVILEGSTVRYEPSHPKPASLSLPITSLHLSLEGADENGVCGFVGPTVECLRFHVANMGEQTVRDYRAIILVPQAFKQPSYGLYDGDLKKEKQSDTTIGERRYAVYDKFMSQPIYKNDSTKIGDLFLSTVVGQHILLWQIRCDDGTFPSENTYGEIKIRISPRGDLIEHVERFVEIT